VLVSFARVFFRARVYLARQDASKKSKATSYQCRPIDRFSKVSRACRGVATLDHLWDSFARHFPPVDAGATEGRAEEPNPKETMTLAACM
jgi:hypothetical protein